MCGINAAGFCLRSAVLSSLWALGQGLPAFVQAWSRNPEGILLQACFSGYRASSGCRKMFISASQNCWRVVEPPGVGSSGRRSVVWLW